MTIRGDESSSIVASMRIGTDTRHLEILSILWFLLFLVLGLETARADEGTATSEDEENDGGKFLAVPVIVTEPAIGEGLGGGLIYFHDTPDDRPRVTNGRTIAKTGRRQKPPPTATGLFGFYTNNDTYTIGVGHSRTFKEDTWRMMAAVATARINATYYFGDIPFGFRLDGDVVLAKLKRRIGNSNWFVGVSTSVADADANFADLDSVIPDFEFTDVGIAVTGAYDTRDDSMLPSEGHVIDLTVWTYDEAFGGDFDYWTSRLKVHSFHKFAEKFVLGLRFEASTADGGVPFYAEPFVSLRGIPAMRYTGEIAGVVEAEFRYQFAERWAALAFAGAGFVDDFTDFPESEDDINAWGIGFRWLALKSENVWIGIDLARGPEDDAYYIQLSHPW